MKPNGEEEGPRAAGAALLPDDVQQLGGVGGPGLYRVTYGRSSRWFVAEDETPPRTEPNRLPS